MVFFTEERCAGRFVVARGVRGTRTCTEDGCFSSAVRTRSIAIWQQQRRDLHVFGSYRAGPNNFITIVALFGPEINGKRKAMKLHLTESQGDLRCEQRPGP